jgi:carboxylesterase type B
VDSGRHGQWDAGDGLDHGGAFVRGGNAVLSYDGSAFARSGVVLVSINYRLGIAGFAELDGAPPDRGLLDQLQALHWVQDNIAAFGGHPRRVTVFGESAGGISVATLLATPRAEGLFTRAIVQSGSPTCAVAKSDARFRDPSHAMAERWRAGGGQAYVYEFAWRTAVADLRACHALEIPFLFDNLDRVPAFTGGEGPAELAAEMQKAWVRFASSGDPGWAPFDADARSVRVFDSSGARAGAPV